MLLIMNAGLHKECFYLGFVILANMFKDMQYATSHGPTFIHKFVLLSE